MIHILKPYLEKDHFAYGLLLGILMPAVLFGILTLVNLFLHQIMPDSSGIPFNTLIMVSIFVNLFSMRYFLVNKKCDRTGRGILMSTFALAAIFFYFLIYD